MYCVATLGETDSFWRYRCFSVKMLDVMKDFIADCEKAGCLVRVFEQIEVKELFLK